MREESSLEMTFVICIILWWSYPVKKKSVNFDMFFKCLVQFFKLITLELECTQSVLWDLRDLNKRQTHKELFVLLDTIEYRIWRKFCYVNPLHIYQNPKLFTYHKLSKQSLHKRRHQFYEIFDLLPLCHHFYLLNKLIK